MLISIHREFLTYPIHRNIHNYGNISDNSPVNRLKKLTHYLNPFAYLGVKKYSVFFPLIFSLAVSLLSEIFAYVIVQDPNIVGIYIIFLNVATIIYFSFRDGIRGGLITTLISILYYFYIIYTRHYHDQQLTSGIQTTIILGLLYYLLALIIGYLKQRIDSLIEREGDEKRRLQAIIQQLPVGVIITDHKGRVVEGNKQVDYILGQQLELGTVTGRDTLATAKFNNKPVTPSQWPLAQALATGKSVTDKEFTLHKEGAKPIFLQISASLITNKQGKTIAAASIINDITIQKQLEKRKDDFVNMASHELKTPITSMKLYVDSLDMRLKNKDEKTSRIIEGLKYQTERLQKLVSDLLDVSRLQTGKLTFAKEEFRLDSLVSETIDELQRITPNKKIIYTVRSLIKIYADKFRIYQVLTNLITNAIKYSPDNSDINISVGKTDRNALVSVQDFGIGIQKDEQKRIFDRLYQVSSDKEKTFPGFGTGLYISKEIIKRHKGNIWVESELDNGSTFFFTLPLKNKEKLK